MKRVFTTDDVRNGIRYVAQLRQKGMEFGPAQPEILEGHCTGCQDKKQFQVEGEERMKNGAVRKHGKCVEPNCGRTISTFVSGAKQSAA